MSPREKYKKAKKCTSCGKPLEPDNGTRATCSPCAIKENKKKNEARATRRQLGLCRTCYEPATVGSHCEKHWFAIAAKRGMGSRKKGEEVKKLLIEQDYKCALTSIPLKIGINASLDHIVPKSKGGTEDLSNLQWVDLNVNYAKNNLSLEEFIQMARKIVEHASRDTSNN